MRTVTPFRSHGTGTPDPTRLRAHGQSLVIEPGALIFHPENIRLGENVYIGHNAIIKGYHRNEMTVGDNVWIGQGCFLHAAGGLTIGSNVGIGPNVSIITSLHGEEGRTVPILFSDLKMAPVIIGADSDIGVGATILPGVMIGKGALVGAGAVVTHDIPDYAVVAGSPARLLRMRPEQPKQLLPHQTSG